MKHDPGPGRDNIAWLLRAARDGSGIAVVEPDGRGVSYAALERRAAGFRAAVEGAGVRADDRVAILLERGADAAAAFLGVLAAGCVAVVVHEALRTRQIERILQRSGASALITTADLLAGLPRAPETRAPILDAAVIPNAEPVDPAARLASDVAQIIFTSGSTGMPKGVTLSHGNLRAGARTVAGYLGIRRTDRIASLLPLSFDYGLNQLLCALATGATLVVERSPVPHRIVAALRAREVTVLAAVPPLWLQLLDVPAFRDAPIPSLRIATNTGGRLPTTAVRRLRRAQPGARLFLMYGLTEAFRSTYLPPGEVDRRPESIGRAIPGAEVLVLREDGSPCDVDEVGELVHRGPTVALGYWDDPEATARVFRPHPLRPAGAPDAERVVFSGDLVRRDRDGFLHFVGRRDGMIKSLGHRVSPDEVVEALHASGEVREAVVAAEPDPVLGARIVAYVVLGRDGSLEDLRAFCRRELPRHLRPARFVVRTRLPRTRTGKYSAPALQGAR